MRSASLFSVSLSLSLSLSLFLFLSLALLLSLSHTYSLSLTPSGKSRGTQGIVKYIKGSDVVFESADMSMYKMAAVAWMFQ
jgi:hypothetical protein